MVDVPAPGLVGEVALFLLPGAAVSGGGGGVAWRPVLLPQPALPPCFWNPSRRFDLSPPPPPPTPAAADCA
jgi:hypothetical protein